MQNLSIYVNNKRWTSPVSSNAKYPYTDMGVGDTATIVPRGNISPIDLHQLDHSVRASAYAAGNNGGVRPQEYGKTFSTRKVYITSVGVNEIKDRVAFTVTRTR